MTPTEYLAEIVLSTLEEARNEPQSRRRAYLACIAVYHLFDYLEAAGEKDVRSRARGECRDAYEAVRSVCNGVKHGETELRHVLRFASGSDYWRPPGRAGEAQAGVSQVGDPRGGREFTAADQRHDIYWSAVRLLNWMKVTFPQVFHGLDLGHLSTS